MFINNKKINELIKMSLSNDNKRSHLLLHESPESDIQRILFCIQPETIIDVHKHKKGTELIICLKGEMAISFIKEGKLEVVTLNDTNPILSFDPTTWHTYMSLKRDTVGVEIKEGPYLFENFIKHNDLNNRVKRLELNKRILREIG